MTLHLLAAADECRSVTDACTATADKHEAASVDDALLRGTRSAEGQTEAQLLLLLLSTVSAHFAFASQVQYTALCCSCAGAIRAMSDRPRS